MVHLLVEEPTKAELEYQQYHAFLDSQPHKVDADFEGVIKRLPKKERSNKVRKGRKL